MIRRLLVVPQRMLGDGPAMEAYLQSHGCRRDWKWITYDRLYGWAMIEVWVGLA